MCAVWEFQKTNGRISEHRPRNLRTALPSSPSKGNPKREQQYAFQVTKHARESRELSYFEAGSCEPHWDSQCHPLIFESL